MAGTLAPGKVAAANTLAWALERYRHSSAWTALSNATRRQREAVYRAVTESAGTVPLREITSETIRAGRERRATKPHAANNFLKAMRGFFRWAAAAEGGNLVPTNPATGVKLLPGKNKDGFHTWTDEEISRYETRWPLGTRERLALDLLLYTGLARGMLCALGNST
jgi:integrase